MVKPHGGNKADCDSFELRRCGKRIPDHEAVLQEETFEFGFLGQAKGSIRAQPDEQLRVEPEAAADQVNTVRQPEMPNQEKVIPSVAENTEVCESANHVSTGKTEPLESAAPGGNDKSVEPSLESTERTEVTSPLTSGSGTLDVTVVIDQSADITMEVTMKVGETIYAVKEQLAVSDPTGCTKASDFDLGVMKSSQMVRLLDETVLTEEHVKLHLLQDQAAGL